MALLSVLNPGGRDTAQSFPNSAGAPSDPGHPPVNYHAYAACVCGGFYRKTGEIPADAKNILVLLRRNGLEDALKAVRSLKESGRQAFVSWKESGLHQVADALSDAKRHDLFRMVCREADGFLSSTPELVPLYAASGCKKGKFIPTPYPVDFEAWNLSRNFEERAGIFIGTREFSVPSRNHLLAVSSASSLGPVTVINTDGKNGERLLRGICPDINIISGTLPYAEYLRLMASHRIVFQLDRSAVPGQVAGDALLVRVPCLGGDGAVDRLGFESLSGPHADAVRIAQELLTDDHACRREIERSERAAREALSFGAVAGQLEEFLG